ncbi:MAG: acyl carrier protein [Pseudomonadales bacterium]|nr:acyl carrier protein [Pseudomonadales bacterium]
MSLETELKELIISCLDLEDISVADIDSDEALFGEGLGLDSIDALELGLAISKKYQVKIDADNEETRTHFASVTNLIRFIENNR